MWGPIEKTCRHPDQPDKFYFRIMYREWFFGPFDSEQEVIDAVITLDKFDSYWDYDCVTFIKGADPLPEDYVFGFQKIGNDFHKHLKEVRLKRGNSDLHCTLRRNDENHHRHK